MTSGHPPGLHTRRSSASVTRSSGVCSTTSRQVIRSNVPSSHGISSGADPDVECAARTSDLGGIGNPKLGNPLGAPPQLVQPEHGRDIFRLQHCLPPRILDPQGPGTKSLLLHKTPFDDVARGAIPRVVRGSILHVARHALARPNRGEVYATPDEADAGAPPRAATNRPVRRRTADKIVACRHRWLPPATHAALTDLMTRLILEHADQSRIRSMTEASHDL